MTIPELAEFDVEFMTPGVVQVTHLATGQFEYFYITPFIFKISAKRLEAKIEKAKRIMRQYYEVCQRAQRS